MFVVNGVCNNKCGSDSTRVRINIIIFVAGTRTVLQIPLNSTIFMTKSNAIQQIEKTECTGT